MSHDPAKLAVLKDYLLERGFTMLEASKAIDALDPVAIVIPRDRIKAFDAADASRFSLWNQLPDPGARSQMQICTLAERYLLDWLRERRERPFAREYLGEWPK